MLAFKMYTDTKLPLPKSIAIPGYYKNPEDFKKVLRAFADYLDVLERREEWLQALESGEYEQCRGALFDDKGYCCLGVAARILGLPLIGALLHDHELIGLRNSSGHPTTVEGLKPYIRNLGYWGPEMSLVALNDDGLTFEEIAQVLREFPQAYFKEFEYAN